MRNRCGIGCARLVASALWLAPLCGTSWADPPREALALASEAASSGLRGSDIVCGTNDIDSFEVLDFNANPVPYFVLAVATGTLFAGPFAPVVDPTVEIYNLNSGALVAANDDNGFGAHTLYVTGMELLGGFLTIQPRDSLVVFNANFPFRVVVRGVGGSCGSYALLIL